MLKDKDIKNLEAFVVLRAIKICGGKGKATDKLGMSMDTLNKYIADFEKNLGVKLVNDGEYQCSLTPIGLRVVKAMEKIVYIWEDFNSEKEYCKNIAGVVRIGLEISSFMMTDNSILMNFLDKYPELRINIIPLYDVETDDKNCDIYFSVRPLMRANSLSLVYQKNVKCGYFAAEEYLQNYGMPKNLKDIIDNHRMISQESEYNKKYQDCCKVEEPKVAASFENGATMIRMLRKGAGIAILPRKLQENGIKLLENIECNEQMPLYLYARSKIKDVPRVRAVINFFKEIVDSL